MSYKSDIVHFGKELLNQNLTNGPSGNISIIDKEAQRVYISPSGIEYHQTTESDVAVVDLAGNIVEGDKKASSELPFHLSLYKKREDIGAVVHTHSLYATVISCLNEEILPIHYMIALSGKKVPIAPYATFGTKKLSENVANYIQDYNALLLQNHGLIAVGKDIKSAFRVAQEIEYVDKIYYLTKIAGGGVILDDNQMSEVIKKFKNYGSSK